MHNFFARKARAPRTSPPARPSVQTNVAKIFFRSLISACAAQHQLRRWAGIPPSPHYASTPQGEPHRRERVRLQRSRAPRPAVASRAPHSLGSRLIWIACWCSRTCSWPKIRPQQPLPTSRPHRFAAPAPTETQVSVRRGVLRPLWPAASVRWSPGAHTISLSCLICCAPCPCAKGRFSRATPLSTCAHKVFYFWSRRKNNNALSRQKYLPVLDGPNF